MKNLIIAFKSRNELYSFAKILKSNNISVNIINSPKTIGSTCTLSIKTDYRFFNQIKSLLLYFKPHSFLGLFAFQTSSNSNQAIRLM